VTWEDDWPVVNAGFGLLDPPVEQEGTWGSQGVPSAADFLTLRGFADFTATVDGGLLVRSTGSAFGSVAPTAALLRRLTSTQCTVSVTLDDLAPGAITGLVLRQSDDFHVRVELGTSDAGLRADLIVRAREDSTLASVNLPAGPVTLSASVASTGISWSVATPGGEDTELGTTPLGALSTETAGGFVGTTFGPYVMGPEGASVLFTAWSQRDLS
jgi:alpha-N-arabinofuranosidase